MRIDPTAQAAVTNEAITSGPARNELAESDNTMHNLLGMLTTGSGKDEDGDGADDLDLNRDGTVFVDEFMQAAHNGVAGMADLLQRLGSGQDEAQEQSPAHLLRKAAEAYARNSG